MERKHRSAEFERGRQVERAFVSDADDASVGYLLYLPPSYATTREKLPLVVFLHGAGERGHDLAAVERHGLPKLIARGAEFPFAVISPQCPRFHWWVDDLQQHLLLQVIEGAVSAYGFDPDRIYLTGISMGGFGVWRLAGAHPERFAAAVPICGGGRIEDAERLVELPIWAFHGALDFIVPLSCSAEMADAVNRAGGRVKLTVYPEAEHDSWTQTYENPAVYEWLLSHRASHRQQVGATVQDLTD